MHRFAWKAVRIAAGLLALALAAMPAAAQKERAYAPENLRTLSYGDQLRVISLEYREQSGGRQIPADQLRFYLDQVNRSNWGFSRIKADIAQSLRGGGGISPPAGQTLRCDSNDHDARRCVPPWRGPSRLVRQVSKSPCVEGRSWSSQDGLITVWSGCRGEFAPATRPPVGPPGGAVVRCESTPGQGRTCAVPWRGRSRLLRQLPGAACVEGRTWQSQAGRVYVLGGCRAEFVAAGATPPTAGGRSVTCASNDGRTATCAWPPGHGVPRLLEQLSKAPCIQGQTWGYRAPTTIWVSRGCRGRFGN